MKLSLLWFSPLFAIEWGKSFLGTVMVQSYQSCQSNACFTAILLRHNSMPACVINVFSPTPTSYIGSKERRQSHPCSFIQETQPCILFAVNRSWDLKRDIA